MVELVLGIEKCEDDDLPIFSLREFIMELSFCFPVVRVLLVKDCREGSMWGRLRFIKIITQGRGYSRERGWIKIRN